MKNSYKDVCPACRTVKTPYYCSLCMRHHAICIDWLQVGVLSERTIAIVKRTAKNKSIVKYTPALDWVKKHEKSMS